MNITRTMLDDAARSSVLEAHQVAELWKFLEARAKATPEFKAAHILYYLGGLVAIGAMTLFMTLGWEQFGGPGLMLIAAVYCAAALAVTEVLLFRKRLSLPAGLTAALAVVTVPLVVYGAQHALGAWPAQEYQHAYRDYHTHIDWRWIMMELATLAGGAVALWRYRLPFLALPVAVTLWYMSMDTVPLLFGAESNSFLSHEAKWVSVAFGLAMLLGAFWVDLRSRLTQDFAFWLYVFGTLTFWGGLTCLDSDSEASKFLYCCTNLLLIAVGAALSRRVFAAFGAFGVAAYLGHLSHTVFKDSMLFPLALTAIGLGVIAAGVYWQRHEKAIGETLRSMLPWQVRELVEMRAS